MGKVLQKKKNRSSVRKVTQKSKKAKNGNKKVNVLGNAIIAENWDRKLTLTQNYRRLGLTSRLNAPAGGVEKKKRSKSANNDPSDNAPESMDPFYTPIAKQRSTTLIPTEARVERDPETGNIIRVIRSEQNDEDDGMIEVAGKLRRKSNPLDDPLEEISNPNALVDFTIGGKGETHAPSSAVVVALEKQAAVEEEALKKRKPRHLSKREADWIETLVKKYGDNTRAMARDRKLNPMQQTEADISRRLKKWKAK